MYENIRFFKPSIVIIEDGFYYIDETTDILYRKSSYGDVIFTFPLDTSLQSTAILSLSYDGHYFWTLQKSSIAYSLVIKKWAIENFSLKLKKTLPLLATSEQYYDSTSFTVEYYETTLSKDITGATVDYCGDSSLFLSDFMFKLEYGMELTIGPNSEGKYDTVVVSNVLDSGEIELSFFPKYDFDEGTKVYFVRNIWLLNKYTNKTSSGCLLKINLVNTTKQTKVLDNDYLYATAITYYLQDNITYLVYTLNTIIKFVDIDTMENIKSMTIDNLQSNQITISKIYALQIQNGSIYRLQKETTYYGYTETYTSYNYQLSPLRSFVDSVSVEAMPKILPANGINLSTIKVAVHDQYSEPKINSIVLVKDSDSVGYITVPTIYTNVNGVAITYYRAGTVPNNVLIMASATQYD